MVNIVNLYIKTVMSIKNIENESQVREKYYFMFVIFRYSYGKKGHVTFSIYITFVAKLFLNAAHLSSL